MEQVLNGRYRLIEQVGTGGMGSVHLAEDLRLGRTVAVKSLRADQDADEVARARMRTEAQLAAQVHHPAVAQVFDFVEAEATAGTSSFIVMEYVEGRTLADLLAADGRLSVNRVLALVQQLAEGLQAAHDLGIVHRDLKPSNVMVTPTGRAVLVDFGIAHSAGCEPLTRTGAVTGTAEYMSPEQVSGRRATPASDLYSLGVLAHHCLGGRSPYRRETAVATAVAHLNDPLPPLGPTVPEPVAALVAQLAAKDPDQRPPSAAAVARHAALLASGTVPDLPVPPGPGPAATGFGAAGSGAARPGRLPRRLRQLARSPRRTRVAGLAGLALLAGLVGIWSLRSGAEEQQVPDVVGLAVAEARAELEAAGLEVRVRRVDLPGRPKGEVVAQDPAGGAREPTDELVTLNAVSGKVPVSARSLVGEPFPEVAATLMDLGFEVVRAEVVRPTDPGVVVGLDRAGRLPQGARITVSVAVPEPASGSPTTTPSTRSTSATHKAAPPPKRAPARQHPGRKAPKAGPGKARTPKKQGPGGPGKKGKGKGRKRP